ncbi:MAG: hypothetical protein ACP5D7_22340 [Limnospira sp.]
MNTYTIRPEKAIAIPLFLFWMGVFAVILISEILSGSFSLFPFLLIGVPLSSFAIFWGVFRYEVNRSRQELTLIFSGETPATSGTPELKMWLLCGLLVLVVTAINLAILTNGQMWLPVAESEPQPSLCSEDRSRSPECN